MVEHDYESDIIDFFTKNLKYSELAAHEICASSYINVCVLASFIKQTQKGTWESLVKECRNDEELAINELQRAAHNVIDAKQSVGLVSVKATIRVKNIAFKLISSDQSENIYTVSRQTRILFKNCNLIKIPDILLMINGIPFSIVQLKWEASGQYANKQGKDQIINDHRDVVSRAVEKNNEDAKLEAKFYQRLCHVVAVDSCNVIACRKLHKMTEIFNNKEQAYYDKTELDFYFENYTEEINRIYVEKPHISTVKSMLDMLYNKKSVAHEFMAYTRMVNSTVNRATRELRVPRMCQKIATELIIEDINQFITRSKLSVVNSDFKCEYRLLELATGAGKSDIAALIVMLASYLHFFRRIILVTDRTDLREQLCNALTGLNLNGATISNIDDTKKLHLAMQSEDYKIIVTTVQAINAYQRKSQQRKTNSFKNLIIIDEAHRSHNGGQHIGMMSCISGQFTRDSNNYVLGLTATPIELTHERFKLIYQYSFQQAVSDGIILSPSRFLYDCAIIPETKITNAEARNLHLSISRINKIDAHIMDVIQFRMDNNNPHKAMLCCESTESADIHYDTITKLLRSKNLVETIPVFLFHTKAIRSTDQTPCKNSTIVSAFLNSKNGIMIVVDKLQTGFDDPNLYLLFLDKKLNGISAVQTVNRVTRKTPGKQECLIISYADGGGVSTIRDALAAQGYSLAKDGLAKQYLSESEIKELYQYITSHHIYSEYCQTESINYAVIPEKIVQEYLNELETYQYNTSPYRWLTEKLDLKTWDGELYNRLNKIINVLKSTEIAREHKPLNLPVLEFENKGLYKLPHDYQPFEVTENARKEPQLDIAAQDASSEDWGISNDSWRSYRKLEESIKSRNGYFDLMWLRLYMEAPLFEIVQQHLLQCSLTKVNDFSEIIRNELYRIEQDIKNVFMEKNEEAKAYVLLMGSNSVAFDNLLRREFILYNLNRMNHYY